MSMALPFRLIGDTERAALRKATQEATQAWAADWFATAPSTAIALTADCGPQAAPSGTWMITSIDADAWVAWKLDDQPCREYAQLLLDAPLGSIAKPTPLLRMLIDDCLHDLAARLLLAAGLGDAGLTVASGSLTEWRTGYGSGAVSGSLGGDLPQQEFVLGPSVVAGISARPSAPPLATPELLPRTNAIGSAKTRIELLLGEAELSLAELANISVGDVIRLKSPFREPLTVKTVDGQPLLKAHLGTRNGRKALQVIGKAS